VFFMHKVYGKGERPLLWLCRTKEHSLPLCDLMRHLHDLSLNDDAWLPHELSIYQQLFKRPAAAFSQDGR
jgi:hypothetical protein